MCKIWITVSNNYQVFNTLSLSFSFCLYKTGSTHSEPWQPICSLTVMLLDFYTQMIGMLCVLCRWADTFCLHCNIFIYVRHIWIKLVLWSRMVSLLHHTSPWTHIWLQPSPSAHRNGRVFRHSVQTACCYWNLNRGKSYSNWNSQTNASRLWWSVCWCEYSKMVQRWRTGASRFEWQNTKRKACDCKWSASSRWRWRFCRFVDFVEK